MNRNDFLKILIGLPILGSSMNLNQLNAISKELPNSKLMPVLFIGHGSPMNAIEDNEFSLRWRELGKQIPTPSAVLCISAHWLTTGTMITAMNNPRTIHDFGGFPQSLFDVQYPAPGSNAIAQETEKLVTKTNLELDHEWGLDHGTWSVVKQMYPEANIPVLQLSIDYYKPGSWHFSLAEDLRKLRQKGVLIIGSGNMVHNLGMLNFRMKETGFDWAMESNHIFKKLIDSQEFKKLCDYENLGSAVKLAIPSPDHYYPLLYTLGIKDKNEELKYFNDKLVMGSISMTSIQIG